MDQLEAMRIFAAVADAGSFSAAARHLGLGQPAVSKAVQRLEGRLGARLLQRSTRAVALTEDGLRYLEAVRGVLDAAEAAQEAVGLAGAGALRGRVRVAASVAFARLQIVPRLGRFFAAHPGLGVELLMSDRFVPLEEEGVDVAIGIGRLPDTSLVARRIGSATRIAVARPDYLALAGRPNSPQDLARLDCVVFTGLDTGARWEFAGPAGMEAVDVSGRLRVSSSDAMREAVLEGLGIGLTPSWMWGDEIAEGRLERVLEGWEPAARPIHAVMAGRRLVPARVRAFVDFLAAEFRAEPETFGG